MLLAGVAAHWRARRRAHTSAGLTVVAAADPLDPHSVVELSPDLVVVDGYGLGPLVRALAADDVVFGVIDDNAELPVDGAAFVLNQNLHADPSPYPGTPVDRLLLGPSWALLRRYVGAVGPIETTDRPDPVLVAMGGADPLGLTLPITAGLLEAGLTVWVGVGAANPQRGALETLAAGEPDRPTLDRGDLLDGYSAAALAVVGAGTTMWELAHLGIPSSSTAVARTAPPPASSSSSVPQGERHGPSPVGCDDPGRGGRGDRREWR